MNSLTTKSKVKTVELITWPLEYKCHGGMSGLFFMNISVIFTTVTQKSVSHLVGISICWMNEGHIVPFIMPNSFMRYTWSSVSFSLFLGLFFLTTYHFLFLTKEGLCGKCWPLIIIHLTSFNCSLQVTSRGVCWVLLRKNTKLPECLTFLSSLSLFQESFWDPQTWFHEAIGQQVLDWLVNTVSPIAIEERFI